MKRKNLQSSWVPLRHTYVDPDVDINSKKIETSNGVSFYFEDILKDPSDIKTNFYSKFSLINDKDIHDILNISSSSAYTRNKFTSHMKLDGDYLHLDTSVTGGFTNNTNWVRCNASNNSQIFDIELIDDNRCTVSFYDGYRSWYLTITTQSTSSSSTSKVCRFQPNLGSGFSIYQTFNYVIDESIGKLVLIKRNLAGNNYIITSLPITNTIETYLYGTTDDAFWLGNKLIIGALTDNLPSNIFNSESVHKYSFDIRRFSKHTNQIKSDTSWVTYKNDNTNNRDIDNCNISPDLETDLLLNTEYYNISGDILPINITFLKNHLDLHNNIGQSSPFSSVPNVKYKEYDKIFTSTRQIKGDEGISLGYNTFNSSIEFPSNKITYFHLPQSLYPYDHLSIHDSKLVEAGAIAGNDPVYSDKIFKYNEDIDKFTTSTYSTSAQIDGTWLCTWLRDVSGVYKWVDRYYDAGKLSWTQALTASPVTTHTDTIINSMSSSLAKYPVVDKPSSMIFEPGALYAYYRLGQDDYTSHVNSLTSSRVSYNLPIHKTVTGAEKPSNTNVYTFSGDSYGMTDVSISRSDSFTISFDLYREDWTNKIGYQLLGNYTHKGIGIFNTKNVTPISLIKEQSENSVIINGYNTDFKKLFSIDTESPDIDSTYIARHDFSGVFYVIFLKQNKHRIRTYTYNGQLLSDNTLPIEATTKLTKYFVYYCNQDGNTYFIYKDSTSSAKKIGLPGLAVHESLSGLTLDGIDFKEKLENVNKSNDLYVDTTGRCLYHNSSGIYIDDILSFTNIDTSIETFTCDSNDNIWVLYSKINDQGTATEPYISKYDKNRTHLLTVSLSSGLAGAGIFKIDTISEFKDGVYRQYPIILQIDKTSDAVRYASLDNDTGVVNNTGLLEDISADYIDSNIDTIFNSNFLNLKYKDEIDSNNVYIDISCTNGVYDIPLSIKIPVHEFKPGWSNFAVRFNSKSNVISTFINGRLVIHTSLTPTSDPLISNFNLDNAFYINNTITYPIVAGTGAFYSNIILPSYLKQPTHYTCSDVKFRDIHVYNISLTHPQIILHYLDDNISSLYWSLPNNKSHYIDEITKFFKYQAPFRKSELFNINIISQQSLSSVKTPLTTSIESDISKYIPDYIDINNVTWRDILSSGAFDTLTPEADSCLTIGGSTAALEVTVSITAGDTEIEITSTDGMSIGDSLIINPDGNTREVVKISGFGSVLLSAPTIYDHAAGEPIVHVPQAIDLWEEITPDIETTTTTTTTTTTPSPIYYEIWSLVTTTTTTTTIDPACVTTTVAPAIDTWLEVKPSSVGTTTTTTEAPYTVPPSFNTTTTEAPTCPV